jgi:hypothetical protein
MAVAPLNMVASWLKRRLREDVPHDLLHLRSEFDPGQRRQRKSLVSPVRWMRKVWVSIIDKV